MSVFDQSVIHQALVCQTGSVCSVFGLGWFVETDHCQNVFLVGEPHCQPDFVLHVMVAMDGMPQPAAAFL